MSKADAGLMGRPPPALQAFVFIITCGFLWTGDVLRERTSPSGSTADHSKFKRCKGLCHRSRGHRGILNCHTEASKQLHQTTHWTWAFTNELTGQELGKRNVVNNFCVATATNCRCTSCHIDSVEGQSFDLTSEKNVDCLACHDTTGTYKKFPTGSGHPPTRTSSASCLRRWTSRRSPRTSASRAGKPAAPARFGGGSNGVKHGDLDASLAKRHGRAHGRGGLNFTCGNAARPAATSRGKPLRDKAVDREGVVIQAIPDLKAFYESCHGMRPHPDTANQKLNDHTDKLACTTCHVPEYARGEHKTKMWWDWSTAGLRENGKGVIKKDADGYDTYHFKKGDFVWEDNVVPEYRGSTVRFATPFGRSHRSGRRGSHQYPRGRPERSGVADRPSR